MIVMQSDDFDLLSQAGVFNDNQPCHIYMICRRPRITLDKDSFKFNGESIDLTFKIQNKEGFDNLDITINNPFGIEPVELQCEYPFNVFSLKTKERELRSKTAIFLQQVIRYDFSAEFLDLEILYIGQSYGVDGARTAPERLKSHETLQAIYAEALHRNPEQEIWLVLFSFEQVGITMFDGKRSKLSDIEEEKDTQRAVKFMTTLASGGISEQQFINFTEAAMIRYFQPVYNKEYKNTFPNPAHKTYRECYDLDINSVCFELGTMESINIKIYSPSVPKKSLHIADYMLHNKKERISMFDFSNI